MTQLFPKNRLWLGHSIAQPAFDDAGEHLVYVRSADGRRGLVRQNLRTGLAEHITAEPAPGGTIGYGGSAYALHHNMVVYASGGQLIALQLDTGAQSTITPKYEGSAAPTISPCGRFAAFVIEIEGHAEILVADTSGSALPVKLTQSPAFAGNPIFSPDGSRIAWMEWIEGRMPWEQSTLHIATFARPAAEADGPAALLPMEVRTLATPNVSYANPHWTPDGECFAYTSDESGWRSLYIAEPDGQGGERVDTGTGEIGGPDWIVGQFAVRCGAEGRRLYAIRRHRSRADLIRVTLPDRRVEVLASDWTALGDLVVHPGQPDLLAYVASSPTSPQVLVTRSGDEEIVRASTAVGLVDREVLAQGEIVEWPAADGTMVYGILYRARNGDGPRPALVMIHGGPTGEVANGWQAQAQYFASKGWHYLIVNYRGGTGSGRAYQNLLDGAWGVVDVEDARTGAEYLVGQGLADPTRLAITGGSAGGYTTMMAVTRDPDFWAAGVALFGIGNLYDSDQGTHRFESHYTSTLVGPLPETAMKWIERSPLTHVRKVKAPVQLFHGKEDKAVPYEQSVEFADAIKAQGGIVELVLYDDEGHGFQKEKNRKDYVEKMDAFLDKYVVNLQGKRPSSLS